VTRQEIRHAVVKLLENKTSAQERVFATREAPWRNVELPGIAVYSLEEQAPRAAYEPIVSDRNLTIAVLLVVKLSDGVDDALDAMALQVESVMRADPTFGGAAMASRYTGCQIEVAAEQERPVGVMRMTYEARYAP